MSIVKALFQFILDIFSFKIQELAKAMLKMHLFFNQENSEFSC